MAKLVVMNDDDGPAVGQAVVGQAVVGQIAECWQMLLQLFSPMDS